MTKLNLFLINIILIGIILWVAYVQINKIKKNKPIINEPVPEIIQEEPQKPEKPQKPKIPEEISKPKTYQEALQLSKLTNKKIVLYFHAPAWCPPCQAMEKNTLPKEIVQNALKKYIFYITDTDLDKKTTQQWNIQSIPTYFIIDDKENKIKSNSGYMSPEEFVKWLN